jgi:hypothetical protein
MNEQEPDHDRWVEAVRRSWSEFSEDTGYLTTVRTEQGTMVNAYLRGRETVVTRVYLDHRSGTVYSVPTYVSRAEAMQTALADPSKRARMAVL